MSEYREIRQYVIELAAKIRAPEALLPTFGHSIDFGHPHIEVDRFGYHYVVVERGKELERRTTRDLDDLLYWIFQAVTFSMACDYEMKHRDPIQDFRRLIWAHQLELLAILQKPWLYRRESEIEAILNENPFVVPHEAG